MFVIVTDKGEPFERFDKLSQAVTCAEEAGFERVIGIPNLEGDGKSVHVLTLADAEGHVHIYEV